jgi:hypothetical protein
MHSVFFLLFVSFFFLRAQFFFFTTEDAEGGLPSVAGLFLSELVCVCGEVGARNRWLLLQSDDRTRSMQQVSCLLESVCRICLCIV